MIWQQLSHDWRTDDHVIEFALANQLSAHIHSRVIADQTYIYSSRAHLLTRAAIRFESHFKSSFGNVKAFNLKKLKLSLSPSPQWPQAALLLGGDGRHVP